MVAVVATPTTPPVTTPEINPTVATAVLLLLQVPPPVPSNKAVVDPEQTVLVPVILAGKALTVTIAVAAQLPIV